jgi:hypothetical protein
MSSLKPDWDQPFPALTPVVPRHYAARRARTQSCMSSEEDGDSHAEHTSTSADRTHDDDPVAEANSLLASLETEHLLAIYLPNQDRPEASVQTRHTISDPKLDAGGVNSVAAIVDSVPDLP